MIGREFVECAERLLTGPAECDFRSAVSRAYYGAFHDARALLQDNGILLPKTEQVHLKVVYCLQDCGDVNAAQAGIDIDLLRLERKRADYDLRDDRYTDVRKARAEVAKARSILGILDKCRTSSIADEFRTKVRAQAKLLGLPVSG